MFLGEAQKRWWQPRRGAMIGQCCHARAMRYRTRCPILQPRACSALRDERGGIRHKADARLDIGDINWRKVRWEKTLGGAATLLVRCSMRLASMLRRRPSVGNGIGCPMRSTHLGTTTDDIYSRTCMSRSPPGHSAALLRPSYMRRPRRTTNSSHTPCRRSPLRQSPPFERSMDLLGRSCACKLALEVRPAEGPGPIWPTSAKAARDP